MQLPPNGPSGKSAIVYIVRRGWHIDIGFAATDSLAPLTRVGDNFAGARYLIFGFGDRHYLMARHKGFPGMLAALWPGPGLVLATGLGAAPEDAFGIGNVIALPLTPDQARAAAEFVEISLSTSAAAVRPAAPGPYAGSLYFSAVPRYSAIYTCNTWAAEALRAAGIPVRTHGVVLAGQLWSQVQQIFRVTQALRSQPPGEPPAPHVAVPVQP